LSYPWEQIILSAFVSTSAHKIIYYYNTFSSANQVILSRLFRI